MLPQIWSVVWSGLAYPTCPSSACLGSAGLRAPPPLRSSKAAALLWVGKAKLTQSECRGWRRWLLARETGGKGLAPQGQGWGGGCNVAGRCACATLASRRHLCVFATGLGNLPRETARQPGRGGLAWGRWDAGLGSFWDISESFGSLIVSGRSVGTIAGVPEASRWGKLTLTRPRTGYGDILGWWEPAS